MPRAGKIIILGMGNVSKELIVGANTKWLRLVGLGVLVFGATSCTNMNESNSRAEPPAEVIEADRQEAPVTLEQHASEQDTLIYNLDRLADQDYTQTYGDGENDKIWYSAAEALGAIGKPAIPHLVERLQSDDDYEVMLTLYALQLATQDPDLTAETDGNYISLPSVLNPRANQHNKAIALSWWNEYRHLWDDE